MNTIDTHVILISEQAVPNITPLLDDSFRPKQVIMIQSPTMQKRADWLEIVLKRFHIKIERWLIDDPWNIEHIRSRIEELALSRENLALNATGGTKLMSIAAYEVFRQLELPIFYVHPEKDRILWLYPKDRTEQDLADRIQLGDYLQIYGASISSRGSEFGVPQTERRLTEQLITHIDRYAPALSTLNFLAQQAKNTGLTVTLKSEQLNNPVLGDLITLFADNHLLQQQANQLRFTDENARFYVNGGWLEQHVYGLCLNIKKQTGIQDIGRSIEVSRNHQGKAVKNELDVAFLRDNRLYLIECKTKKYTSNDALRSDGADTLYKLDTLRDLLGGLQAKAMLVSFTPLQQYDETRAKDLRLNLCCYQELPLLTEKLLSWINGH
jgi:hypothetical protein